jgi:hypothetical protein
MSSVCLPLADCVSQSAAAPRTALLLVAHPGHELRLFGWMAALRPQVLVLTDGSGPEQCSRLNSTRSLLRELGCTPGALFGRYTDQEIYRALLTQQHTLFVDLAIELVQILTATHFDVIIADPLEGHNPTHDLCAMLLGAALGKLRRLQARLPQCFEYELVCRHPVPDATQPRIQLNRQELRHKLAAAFAYQGLKGEISLALIIEGVRAQATELLRAVDHDLSTTAPSVYPPHYESHGARQRAAGRYAEVIRYSEHVRPVAEALRQWQCA